MNPDYTAEKRSYDLRLVEWLGLDPAALYRIDDTDVTHPAPFGGGEIFVGYEVTWEAYDRMDQAVAKRPNWFPTPRQTYSTGEAAVRVRDGVVLAGDEAERMRAEVGPRPEMFTPEETALLRGRLG